MRPRPFHNSRPFLSLSKATFRLGDELVFAETSWVFERGQQWAILGSNGAGKSLFADAIRGRLPLIGGELRYHFRPPQHLTPEEAIGHVSFEDRKSEVHETVVQSRWNSLDQDQGLLVRDFLSYERVMDINPFEVSAPDRELKANFDRRRVKAVRLLDLDRFLPRRLLSLSNGETQRVHLARALCHPLRLLILDEPFAGLDATHREDFRQALERLMQTRLRVLLLTTRPEDLPRQITHALWLEHCRLKAAGPTGEVLRLVNRSRKNRQNARRQLRFSSSNRAWRGSKQSLGSTLIDLRNVTVRYGKATILRNINWSVRTGESWALLGPNGSGKTTLLSLILGDNPQAYSKHVVVFGKQRGDGESMWDLKKRIGWVSPELHLHFNPEATCFEAVASGFRESVGLFEALTSSQRAAARKWLADFGLLKMARTPLYGLSAGLQRMVLLTRALVKRPELLILDEPCQNLDEAHRDLFIKTVDRFIRKQALTAIYVTHREEEIPPSIQHVLRLPQGHSELSVSGGHAPWFPVPRILR